MDKAKLNVAQQQAVSHLGGPLLVLAGAGTGKTRVLTHRVARIIQDTCTPAYRMLCVTFTNKAAQEMRERIEELVPGQTEGLWLGTFHSLAVRILRKHAVGIGVEQDFLIVDSDDQHRLLRQILQEMRLNPKEIRPGKVMPYLQGWKDRALEPDRVPEAERNALDGLAVDIYERYQKRLLSLNACDFGDLLLYNIKLFAHNSEVLQYYQERFRYILVDEYQDTNMIQNLWLSLLAHQHRQLCCVGDDDQSIYGWRGAEIRNILEFQQRFSEATVIRLEENYRSTQNILDAAAGVIAHNRDRLGKRLQATRGAGELIGLIGFWDSRAEAMAIADEVVKRHFQGVGYNQQAILIRAGHVSQMLETTFAQARIPYRIYGGLRFYEREEIRDAVAYLRLIQRPDDDLAFDRIINKPARGIGNTSQDKVRQYAASQDFSRIAAVRAMLDAGMLTERVAGAFGSFLEQHAHWQERNEVLSGADLLHEVLGDAGVFTFWRASSKIQAETKLENLGELESAIAEFTSLEAFLEHVALVMDDDRSDGAESVTITTIHAAKGHEFDYVFLPAWEEGIFPNPRSVDEDDGKSLEEERRLAYVAMTRAKQRLDISFARERFMHGQIKDTGPSRFLREIPTECLETPLAEIIERIVYSWSHERAPAAKRSDSPSQRL
ncbi:MAG: UvrD-helicase domain-containing protein [Alphaproteobacteria bacterium]|nr:UvrD-helicase domain-containing protein [Alphaproteobacteria bacterium]